MSNAFYALLIVLGAGLATPLGGALTLFSKRDNSRVLSLGMGLAAGVLIYLALQGLLSESFTELGTLYGREGQLITLGAFAGGILLMLVMDMLIPAGHHTHDARKGLTDHERTALSDRDRKVLLSTGLTTAVIISIHNIPEGMMLYLTAAQDPLQALPVMVAVGIHNIPIGLAIGIPLYYASGNRLLTIGVCLASGLMELLGALVGVLVAAPMQSPAPSAALLAVIAGIMVYVSFDELIPASIHYGRSHTGLLGILLGMIGMGLAMILL